jgi:hypothetical protein
LTAYDLVTFHHFGANYPDALLLDIVLKALLEMIERQPVVFSEQLGDDQPATQQKRLRRRALRQGWLLRRHYEGHPVPDAPTSQGENLRVLPPPHRRVPEEQIFYPHKRTRRLFQGDPIENHLGAGGRWVLQQSLDDLRHLRELRELGMAIFLDRPLDAGKNAVEPDQTPLLSYLAFSRSIAQRRLEQLAADPCLAMSNAAYEACRDRLDQELDITGLPVESVNPSPRAGVVSLADVRKAAPDFVLLRTTTQSAAVFFRLYNFDSVRKRYPFLDLDQGRPMLILRKAPAGLVIFDEQIRRRIELVFDPARGYRSRGGVEYSVSPLTVVRVWEAAGNGAMREHELTEAPLQLPEVQ